MTNKEVETMIAAIEGYLQKKWEIENRLSAISNPSKGAVIDKGIELQKEYLGVCAEALKYIADNGKNYLVYSAAITSVEADPQNDAYISVQLKDLEEKNEIEINKKLSLSKKMVLSAIGADSIDQVANNTFITLGLVEENGNIKLRALQITNKKEDALLFTLGGLTKEFSVTIGNDNIK